MNVFYLHGFTSSPRSKKGTWIKTKFAEYNIDLHLPDLNVPTFEHLRMTAMLETVQREIAACPPGDVVLIGSSLGGTVAVNFADHAHFGATPEGQRISHVILLAPAFDIQQNWTRRIGEDGIAAWRDRGWINVYNYAIAAEAPVDYGFLEDVTRYQPYQARIDVPILDYHGTHDDTVPHTQSEQFASGRANVDLRLIDSDHELLDQTNVMWAGITGFLQV